jgi:hypothetical protein
MSKWVQHEGKWKLSAAYLRSFLTIETLEPHHLKLVDENYGRRYWLGGYFDGGIYFDNVVTVDAYDKKKKEWFQVDQYIGA